MRIAVVVKATQTSTKSPMVPSSARVCLKARAYADTALTGRSPSISSNAQAVAAWTRPSPSNVSIVPIITATSAEPPAASPVLMIPTMSRLSSESHCRRVMTREIGIRSSPIPKKTGARLMYIRPDAARIWPQLRRRPSRTGATGVHVARTVTKTISPSTTPSSSAMRPGLRRTRTSPREPFSTPLQKRSVAPVPKSPPVGAA
jgi:hypothetical protein